MQLRLSSLYAQFDILSQKGLNMDKTNIKGSISITTILVIIALVSGGGYLFLKGLEAKITAKITGCELESTDFQTVLDFDYINGWIVVNVKVGSSDKEYPFFFDTGAQTVIMDSLLDELQQDEYDSFSFGEGSDAVEHAFNNEIISISRLQMGDIVFKDIGSLSAKNSRWSMLNCVSPYGIIGCNILEKLAFQINYEKQQIILTDHIETLPNFSDNEWVDYKPVMTQESPVIQAMINDKINVSLLVDTGMSGGATLESDTVYQKIIREYPGKYSKYSLVPSLRIRGESGDQIQALKFVDANLKIGENSSSFLPIYVQNQAEGRYSGLIGNQYLQNYIITLDYGKRRIGFIPSSTNTHSNSNFGITFVAGESGMTVSKIFEGSEPDLAGIEPGDKVYSINGTIISDLSDDIFCQIYRDEYYFSSPEDSLLKFEIDLDGSIVGFTLMREQKQSI